MRDFLKIRLLLKSRTQFEDVLEQIYYETLLVKPSRNRTFASSYNWLIVFYGRFRFVITFSQLTTFVTKAPFNSSVDHK